MKTEEKISKFLNEGKYDPRIKKTLSRASDAFWAVIAKEFKEASSGDLSPHATIQFEKAAENAVKEWVNFNVGE